MDERWIKIIHILYHENKPMSIDELSIILDCAYNTIKATISKNRNLSIDYGFRLIESNDLQIEITDSNKFSFFLSYANSNDDRINEIIIRLLSSDDFTKIENLAEKMFVSRATIDRFIPTIKNIVKKYRLELISRPKYGIAIKGSEINKRICMAQYKQTNIIDTYSEKITNNVVIRVQSIIENAIKSNGLQINDINFYNLVQHSLIMISRIRRGNEIFEIPKIPVDTNNENEFKAGKEICDGFEKHFRIIISEAERKYIVIHLLGKRIFSNEKVIRTDVFECINEMFDEINKVKGVDFHQDIELMTALALHIQPLISRLEFGLLQQNPIKNRIKKELSKGFELSLYASEIIQRKYKCYMNEDEAAYLAMHFTLALERKEKQVVKKKIAVVCSTGLGTAKLIQFRLMGYFNYQENDIILTSLLQIDALDFDEIECILTTIPLEKKYSVPVISIDLMFNDASQKKVTRYLNKKGKDLELHNLVKEKFVYSNYEFETREEVLRFMSDKIVEEYSLDLYDEIMKREELSSTEVGNQLACPHPYQYIGDELIISAMSLKKPIKWKFGNVRLILLLCYPVDDYRAEIISNAISDLIMKDSVINELVDSLSFEKLNQELKR